MDSWEVQQYRDHKQQIENREKQAWDYLIRLHESSEIRGYPNPENMVSDLFMTIDKLHELENRVRTMDARILDLEQLFVSSEDFETMLKENPNIRDTYKQLLMYVAIEKGKQHQNGN